MKRESGIDLIRITGLLFVVGIHQFLYNRFYYEPQVGALMWAADTWRWLFFCCNGLFMMMTGYLRCGKKFEKGCYKSLIPILIGYTICCCIIYPAQWLMGEHLPAIDWITRFVTFGNYAWYIEMYIGLVLFSPVINLGLMQLKDRDLIRFACVMVFVTSLYYITPLDIIPNYWSSMYPVTYYVIGAAIRRIKPRVKIWEGLGLALLICMGLGAVSIISTDQGFSKGFTQGYGGFWTMLTTTCIFLALYRVKVSEKAAKVLAWASGGVFEGYLLSKAFDIWTYPLVKQWHKPEHYLLVFLCVTLPTFFTVLLLGKAVHVLSGKIANAIPGFREKPSRRKNADSGFLPSG